MKEYNLGRSANARETLEQGVTLADYLKANFPAFQDRTYRHWFRKITPAIPPLPPTPDMHFDEIVSIQIHDGLSHVTAVAKADDKIYLLKDAHRVFEGEYVGLFYRVSTDLSKFAVLSTDTVGKKALHLVGSEGKQRTVLSDKEKVELLDASGSLDTMLIEYEGDQRKTIALVDQFGETPSEFSGQDVRILMKIPAQIGRANLFDHAILGINTGTSTEIHVMNALGHDVGEHIVDKPLDMGSLVVVNYNHDADAIVWYGTDQDGFHVYRGDQEIAAGKKLMNPVPVSTSTDMERVLVLGSVREGLTSVIVNGIEIYTSESHPWIVQYNETMTLVGIAFRKADNVYDQDLVVFSTEDPQRLIVQQGVIISGLLSSSEGIEASYIKNGKLYKMIARENPDESSPVIESAVAA